VTPIRQVELAGELDDVSLPPATSQCLLIFRWQGRVVGRVLVPVTHTTLSASQVRALAREAAPNTTLDACIDGLVGYDTRRFLGAPTASVSVAICTRERPDDLARALHAIQALNPPPLEVLVIDNAPATSSTKELVECAPFARYVREDRRGLNAARNRALREARGDIVAFTDDDAVPEPQWLAGLVPNFSEPCVAIATGLTLPLELETEGQELFEQHCSFVRGFHRRVFDAQQHSPFAVGPIGAGANMAVRRELTLRLGGFDERLDGGMPTRSGGDHDLFVRTLLADHRIVYDPTAVSWHRHRRTTHELLDTVYGYGVGVYAMWTGLIVERREFGVLRLAWHWFRHGQARNLLQRRDAFLRSVAWHELKGCLRGPFAWFAARRLLQKTTA
jgi:glycosyltransferase involved in cell wall biosynthesis